MGKGSTAVFRRLGIIMTIAAAFLAIAPLARADSASLAVLDAAGNDDPVQNVGRTFDFTVNALTPGYFYVRYRSAGGSSCAPTPSTDSGNSLIDDYHDSGTTHIRSAYNWDSVGSFQFCMWIEDDSGNYTVSSQVMTFRAPRQSLSYSTDPATVAPNVPVTLRFFATTEAPRSLYVKIRPSGGAACAPTAASDSGNYLISGDDVDGQITISDVENFDQAGTFQLCAWLADSSGDTNPLGGSYSWTLTVGAPPAAQPTAPPVVKPAPRPAPPKVIHKKPKKRVKKKH